MKAVEVAQYESDTSDEEISEEQSVRNENKGVHRKKKTKFWIKEATFNNAGEAEASIKNEWSKHYTNYTEDGRRVYYRCRKVKRRGPQCSSSVSLLYHTDSDKVTMYRTEADHDHNDNEVHGIANDVKQCIEELYNDGIKKPKLIIRALQSRQLKVPTYAQLNNYLGYYKRKKYGSHTISLGELDQWCQDNSNVPSDENKAFVVSYKILYDDEDVDDTSGRIFRLFLSSVPLLNIGSVASHIEADATYKLAFHPLGLAICSNEKAEDFEFIFNALQIGMGKIKKNLLKPKSLVCDAADSITNGFRSVFGNSFDQIMYWSHMKRKIENRICQSIDRDPLSANPKQFATEPTITSDLWTRSYQ
ncbi:unnamed protein product [Rotaria sp. Silwood1]|nr:unnamed protein product [Rotaria sp. Silwood1]